MPIATVYQLDLLYEIPGKQGAITFHLNQLSAGGSPPSMDSQVCGNACADVIADALKDCLPSQLSFLGAYIRQATIGSPVVYPFLYLFTTPYTGALTGEILPEGTGPLVLVGPNELSASPRRQVNRKFLPVMREADQEDGAIANSLVTLIDTAFDTIMDSSNFNSSQFELVTYSKVAEEAFETFVWPAEFARIADQIARLVRRRPRTQGRS